jgi:hypothetical protein
MPQNFPTAIALKELFKNIYEVLVGQNAPLNDKADIRIRATAWSMVAQIINREVIDNTLQNFALTASLDTLINVFGAEYDLEYKSEESAILTVTMVATIDSTEIIAGTDFTGDSNGIIYYNVNPAITAGGSVTLDITARTAGAIGNLQINDTLSIARDFPGVEKTATVTAIVNSGADAEETETYRQRVLDIIRAPGGGANSADFRNWGQLEENVARIYPYAGRDVNDPLFPGSPPWRTCYVEATTSYDPDGIADATLLAAVRETIITDANDGRHRQPLGLTNATLTVVSIYRNPLYITITGAQFIAGTEAQVKADINTAVTNYFLSLFPFIEGLDIDADRNDLVTPVSISDAVQPVLKANGASAQDVLFTDTPGGGPLPSYYLQMGEKVKNGGITYT